ncbi:hypothetical protein ACF1CG_23730 [Streptomyces sp. NPDC014773]|uniref:hypothetical protein n=1 Tax=Streptomyces sp. NPDC014773 TaxID=3364908 RepID=UPI0036FA376B
MPRTLRRPARPHRPTRPQPGGPPPHRPLLLADHVGGSAGPEDWAGLSESGGASVAVVPATEHPSA